MWAIVVPLWHCYRLLGGFCVTNRKARINSFIDEESVGVRLYGHGNDISANRRS